MSRRQRCPICGHERQVPTRRDPVCSGCRRFSNAQPTSADALTGGRWVQRGWIQVWVEA